MSTTPEEVHPEHDFPTPENKNEWSEEQLEEFREAKEQALEQEAEENLGEVSEEHKVAIEALRDPEEDDTAKVPFSGTTLTVKTYTDEWFDKQHERLQRYRDDEDVQRTLLPKLVAYMVEAPEAYTDEELWREYAKQYGRDELAVTFARLLEPKLDRLEDDEVIRRFRDRR